LRSWTFVCFGLRRLNPEELPVDRKELITYLRVLNTPLGQLIKLRPASLNETRGSATSATRALGSGTLRDIVKGLPTSAFQRLRAKPFTDPVRGLRLPPKHHNNSHSIWRRPENEIVARSIYLLSNDPSEDPSVPPAHAA
jgi:hypothetical protein